MLMCFNKLIDRPTERKTGRHANWSARRQLTHTDRRTHSSIGQYAIQNDIHGYRPSLQGITERRGLRSTGPLEEAYIDW